MSHDEQAIADQFNRLHEAMKRNVKSTPVLGGFKHEWWNADGTFETMTVTTSTYINQPIILSTAGVLY